MDTYYQLVTIESIPIGKYLEKNPACDVLVLVKFLRSTAAGNKKPPGGGLAVRIIGCQAMAAAVGVLVVRGPLLARISF